MDVAREELLELLELQKIDSLIDRLDARRRNLPEQATLEQLEEGLADLEKAQGEQQAVVEDIVMRHKKIDGEVESIRAKLDREQQRLYSGQVANPRELSDLQKEVESLKRRQTMVEDSELEVMEEREQGEKAFMDLQEQIAAIGAEIASAKAARDSASEEIDRQLEENRIERDKQAPKISSELISLYEDLRASKAGVGAAALVDGVCQGCRMRLPAQEYERVRRSTGLVRCDDCRRILIPL